MRRAFTIAAFCLSCLAPGIAPALERDDLTLYLPFEDRPEPALAAGAAGPLGESAAGVSYVPGVIGKAIVCGRDERDTPAYPIAGHLNERRGALALWFKPVNWRAGDSQQHVVIQGGGRFLLYHYWESQAFCFYWMRGSNVVWGAGGMYVSATPDEWHHVVFSWGDGKCTAYVDGQRRAEVIDMPGDVPAWAEGEQFTLSPPLWTKDGRNLTALDELMCFSRPLAPQEAAALYRHGKVALAAPQMRLPRLTGIPVVDGQSSETAWRPTAVATDFVDGLFGNLMIEPVKARLGYSERFLHVAVEPSPRQRPVAVELWVSGQAERRDRLIVTADGAVQHLRPDGSAAPTPAEAVRAAVGPAWELLVGWPALGLAKPPPQLSLNVVSRFSDAPGDLASWADVSRHPGGPADPAAYGTCTLSPTGPVFALAGTGPLHHARLALRGEVRGPTAAPVEAQIRLQPSDLHEIVDPQTFIRTWSGGQIKLDRALPPRSPQLTADTSFSDTDLNSLHLSLKDPQGIIYAAQRPFVAMPPVVATVHLFPSAGRLEIRADTSNYSEAPPERLSLHVELRDARGEPVARVSADGLSRPHRVLALPLAPLAPGNYLSRTTLLQDGRPVSTFEAPFRQMSPGPWHQSPLGRNDSVPEPFTPMIVAGQSVSVWGRTYRWQDSLFPVQITSGGQDLLAAPVQLLPVAAATRDIAPAVDATPATVEVLEHTSSRAVVRCTGTVGGLGVEARHLIEFDGMCLTQLRVAPGHLPGLTLVMPLKREHATLYHHFLNAGLVRGQTVRGRGVDLKGEAEFGFLNTLWLGNEDRGLNWFAEHPGGWQLGQGLAPLAVRARDEDTLMLVRLANHEVDLREPMALTFGLIATPVRPMPPNWRFLRAKRDWGYTWCGEASFTQSNNDVTNVLPGWKENLARHLQSTPLFVPYQRPDWINTKVPEATYCRDEWQSTPPYVSGSDDGSANTHLSVCLASDWQDFLLHYLMKAYDENDMVGFYFDGALPQRCKNQAHGCGWVDAQGQVQPSYPLLAYREFYKRLAIECAKRGRPRLVWVHCSNCLEMPTLSCTDMTWDGEQFSTAATAARGYATLFTMPYFRAEFLGQPFGLPVQWLGELFDKSGQEPIGQREIDTMLLFALPHGVADNTLASNLGNAASAAYLTSVLEAQDAFGVRAPDARFLPYWSNGNVISLGPRDDNLVCSVWSRPGRALLLFANATGAGAQVTARADVTALGLAGATRAADLMSGEPVPVSDGVLAFELPASRWRGVVLSVDHR